MGINYTAAFDGITRGLGNVAQMMNIYHGIRDRQDKRIEREEDKAYRDKVYEEGVRRFNDTYKLEVQKQQANERYQQGQLAIQKGTLGYHYARLGYEREKDQLARDAFTQTQLLINNLSPTGDNAGELNIGDVGTGYDGSPSGFTNDDFKGLDSSVINQETSAVAKVLNASIPEGLPTNGLFGLKQNDDGTITPVYVYKTSDQEGNTQKVMTPIGEAMKSEDLHKMLSENPDTANLMLTSALREHQSIDKPDAKTRLSRTELGNRIKMLATIAASGDSATQTAAAKEMANIKASIGTPAEGLTGQLLNNTLTAQQKRADTIATENNNVLAQHAGNLTQQQLDAVGVTQTGIQSTIDYLSGGSSSGGNGKKSSKGGSTVDRMYANAIMQYTIGVRGDKLTDAEIKGSKFRAKALQIVDQMKKYDITDPAVAIASVTNARTFADDKEKVKLANAGVARAVSQLRHMGVDERTIAAAIDVGTTQLSKDLFINNVTNNILKAAGVEQPSSKQRMQTVDISNYYNMDY